MQLKAAQRMYEELHKEAPWHDGSFSNWSKNWSTGRPFHADDGVTIWVSRDDLTPDDDFLAQQRPSNVPESGDG